MVMSAESREIKLEFTKHFGKHLKPVQTASDLCQSLLILCNKGVPVNVSYIDCNILADVITHAPMMSLSLPRLICSQPDSTCW